MRIKQLEKYGLDKRTIDYYTNLGMIPYTTEDGSKYRDYGDDAVVAVKKIVILRDVGLSVKEIKEALNNHSYFTTAMWNKHIEQLKERMIEAQRHFEEMIHYAEELRDSSSMVLRFAEEFDDPSESRIYTKIMAHVFSKIRSFIYSLSQDGILESSTSQDEDISDLSDFFDVFIQRLERFHDKGIAPEAIEVQQLLGTLHQRLLRYYGTAVYYIYTIIKDIPPKDLGISEDDSEDYALFLEMFDICANWFRYAKSIDAALDMEMFASKFASEIKAFDEKVEESTYDAMAEIIQDVCKLPSQISLDFASEQKFKYGFEAGMDWAKEDLNDPSDLSEEGKAFEAYLFSAIKEYIHSLHSDPSSNEI